MVILIACYSTDSLPSPLDTASVAHAHTEQALRIKSCPARTQQQYDLRHAAAAILLVQSPNFKDFMQQLLPAEQAASKPSPKEPSSIPNAAPKGSPHADKQQAQRASSTAKASTPKRQDQVTTKPAGPKSTDKDKDKDRQERDRSHSARRDAARSHPVRLLSQARKWQALVWKAI